MRAPGASTELFDTTPLGLTAATIGAAGQGDAREHLGNGADLEDRLPVRCRIGGRVEAAVSHHRAAALRTQAQDEVSDLHTADRIEAAHGLVQKDDIGLEPGDAIQRRFYFTVF